MLALGRVKLLGKEVPGQSSAFPIVLVVDVIVSAGRAAIDLSQQPLQGCPRMHLTIAALLLLSILLPESAPAAEAPPRNPFLAASEKIPIIRPVKGTDLPVRATLRQLGVPSSTFYGRDSRSQSLLLIYSA